MISTHIEKTGDKTPEEVLELVKRVLSLSNVYKITIDPEAIKVERQVENESEPALPPTDNETGLPDLEFLLGRLELTPWPLDTREHPYRMLAQVAQYLSSKNLSPSIILVGEQDREMFAAWLGYDSYPETHFMGFRIIYYDTESLSEKVVVVGTKGTSRYLTDAVEGIVVDLV